MQSPQLGTLASLTVHGRLGSWGGSKTGSMLGREPPKPANRKTEDTGISERDKYPSRWSRHLPSRSRILFWRWMPLPFILSKKRAGPTLVFYNTLVVELLDQVVGGLNSLLHQRSSSPCTAPPEENTLSTQVRAILGWVILHSSCCSCTTVHKQIQDALAQAEGPGAKMNL